MQPKFTIGQQDLGANSVVVVLSGDILLGAGAEAIEAAIAALLRDGKRLIVFDIAGVTRLDSTGIGRFISSYNQAQAAGGEMRIAGASPRLLHVFHINRLDTVFPFFATVQEAAA